MNNEGWLIDIETEVEQERRNYKGPHCCMTMHYGLLSDANVLFYNAKYDEYGIKIPKTKRYLLMTYCSWCEKKLPPSLRIKWAEKLKEEHGLKDPMDLDKKKIPREFLNDEWWKKRNINKNYFDYCNNQKKEYSSREMHVCLELHKELLDGQSLLNYSLKYREYGINIPRSSTIMLMDYCMFCGKKLPLSVRDEWFDILEKEYGLEDPYWPKQNKKKIPAEFLTDEWWKKRGL